MIGETDGLNAYQIYRALQAMDINYNGRVDKSELGQPANQLDLIAGGADSVMLSQAATWAAYSFKPLSLFGNYGAALLAARSLDGNLNGVIDPDEIAFSADLRRRLSSSADGTVTVSDLTDALAMGTIGLGGHLRSY